MKLGKGTYVCDSARIIGRVECGEDCFFLFGSVARGDGGSISIGDRVNLQDNACIHADPHAPVVVGNDVSIGHGAVVHGCTIESGTIVGMNSTVLNGARVGKGCIIGAGAVVPENAVIPDFSLAVGIPAKVIRTNPAMIEQCMLNSAAYQQLKQQYKAGEFRIVSKM